MVAFKINLFRRIFRRLPVIGIFDLRLQTWYRAYFGYEDYKKSGWFEFWNNWGLSNVHLKPSDSITLEKGGDPLVYWERARQVVRPIAVRTRTPADLFLRLASKRNKNRKQEAYLCRPTIISRGWKSMELKFSKWRLAKLPRSEHADSWNTDVS